MQFALKPMNWTTDLNINRKNAKINTTNPFIILISNYVS